MIGQNTEKNSGDLRRLAVTQTPVKNQQPMLVWKTLIMIITIVIKIIENLAIIQDHSLNGQGRNSVKWSKRPENWWLIHVLTSERWHRLTVSRKERGGGLTNIVDCIDASLQGPKNYIKKSKERLITVASNSLSNIRTVKQQKLENRNGKRNNCMDISSNKLARLHTRRPRYGYEKDISREKLKLFK